jgi:hypothetical protein
MYTADVSCASQNLSDTHNTIPLRKYLIDHRMGRWTPYQARGPNYFVFCGARKEIITRW